MNKNLLFFFTIACSFSLNAQDFTGMWRGEFLDRSTSKLNWGDERCEYVLELEVQGTSVIGSSYTYYSDQGKKYYTICKLKGFVDRKRKYIEVRETERTKTNVPINVHNCLQVHKLSYSKDGTLETIEGNWEPAPNQSTMYDCGWGSTVLTRKSLSATYPGFNSNLVKNNIAAAKKKSAEKKAMPEKIITKTPVRKNTELKPETEQSLTKKETIKQEAGISSQVSGNKRHITEKKASLEPDAKLEKRVNKVLKTIEVESEQVRVDLYDNGDIDGDSVSVFFNGQMLLANKRLCAKPLTLHLNIEDSEKINELVMYAENLGSIPPNTAIMIVTDGPRRYEVRITSDLQKSGAINFVHKGANAKN